MTLGELRCESNVMSVELERPHSGVESQLNILLNRKWL